MQLTGVQSLCWEYDSVKFVLKQKELRIKHWAVQPAELSRPFGVPKTGGVSTGSQFSFLVKTKMKCEKLVKIKKIKHLNMFDQNNYLSEVPKYVLSERVTTACWRQFGVKTHQRQVWKAGKKECEKEFTEWKYTNEEPKE